MKKYVCVCVCVYTYTFIYIYTYKYAHLDEEDRGLSQGEKHPLSAAAIGSMALAPKTKIPKSHLTI